MIRTGDVVEETVQVVALEQGGARGTRVVAETERRLRKITARACGAGRMEQATWWLDPAAWLRFLARHAGGAADGALGRRFPVSVFDEGRRV
jgi:hypothetical protein